LLLNKSIPNDRLLPAVLETEEIRLEGEISAPREAFVGLNYRNLRAGTNIV
jgi:hypothetical protein